MNKSSQWLIEAVDLTRIYGDGEEIRALDGVNLKIEPGELVTVMGPSGSGKSTLLNIIGALDKPTDGQVYVDGENVQEIKDKDSFRAEKIGFIFQLHNLLPTMTALENIEIPMNGRARAADQKERATELLNLVGLGDRPDHLPSQLSGGQRQRVAVARALANNPPLVLADEPTGSLDSKAGRELMDLLKDLNQDQGVTFLVVTHDQSVARQTNRVVVMEDGKIVREDLVGSPIEEDLKQWRHSGLGRRFIEDDMGSLRQMGVSQAQVAQIKKLLATANENEDH
jgi:putative ABC transport system ATP-binding protein